MEKDKDDEFNERILTALMKQVKNSDSKFAELEKNLSVKEAELQYLVKLYDEKISSLTDELEDEKKRASKLEEQMNNVTVRFSAKDDEIIDTISQQDKKIQELSKELKKKVETLARQTSRIEAIELELKTFKSHELFASDTSGGERLKCSECGAAGKDIKLVEDKTKVLSYVGNMPMYAKIKVCKKCGHEF
jgi:DNA repair exonuclease SbcCD ATPase subunit